MRLSAGDKWNGVRIAGGVRCLLDGEDISCEVLEASEEGGWVRCWVRDRDGRPMSLYNDDGNFIGVEDQLRYGKVEFGLVINAPYGLVKEWRKRKVEEQLA